MPSYLRLAPSSRPSGVRAYFSLASARATLPHCPAFAVACSHTPCFSPLSPVQGSSFAYSSSRWFARVYSNSPVPSPAPLPGFVIAGLGNSQFPYTRHSLGQYVLPYLSSYFADELKNSTGSPDLAKQDKKLVFPQKWFFNGILHAKLEATMYHSRVDVSLAEMERDGGLHTETEPAERVALHFLYTDALMNISGRPIVGAVKDLLPPQHPRANWHLIVLVDDLDLHPGVVKVQRGGSARGHNGIRSIAAAIGHNNFWRVRMGIGRPGKKGVSYDIRVADYVLQVLPEEDLASYRAGGDALKRVAASVAGIVSKVSGANRAKPDTQAPTRADC